MFREAKHYLRSVLVGMLMLLVHPASLSADALPSTRQWIRPEPGWLFLLDSNDGGKESHVWLVDPTEGQIRGDITLGNAPDMALSPDGTRLYVTFIDTGTFANQFAVIDAGTGAVVKVLDNPDGMGWHVPAPTSFMGVSDDGRLVFVLRRLTKGFDLDEFFLSAFDTLSADFLPNQIALGSCISPTILPLRGRRVVVSCGLTSVVHVLELDQNGGSKTDTRIAGLAQPIPDRGKGAHAIASVTADSSREKMYFVGRDGQLAIVASTNLSTTAITSGLLLRRWLPYRSTVLAQDGRLLYATAKVVGNFSGGSSELLAIRTDTAEPAAVLRPSRPVWNIARSASGDRLYTSGPGGLCVIDTATFREVGFIKGGVSPSLIAISPR